MRGGSRRTSNRVWVGLAIVGVAGIGGLAAGLSARAGLGQEPSAVVADMPPADIVSLRFPADWGESSPAEPAPRMLAYASADPGMILFNPNPTYALADAKSSIVPSSIVPSSIVPSSIVPSSIVPSSIVPSSSGPSSSADQSSTADMPPPWAEAPAKPKAAAPAPAKMALASTSSKPAVAPANKPVRRSNAVLNDSQIVSIRKRLNLTPDQERYWPAVEAELRKMEYNKSAQGVRMASIDMSKMDVEGLKSAGFPLVMSFNDDQKRELKSLAHLLGLESVMSGI
jgi:hypothetical protein